MSNIRLIKYSSVEAGPFTKQNNRVNFDIPMESDTVYNLARSYLICDVSVATTDGTPNQDGKHNVVFGSLEKNHKYSSGCLVMNSSLESDTKGMIQFNRNVNFFMQNYNLYRKSKDELDAESIFQDNGYDDWSQRVPSHPFLDKMDNAIAGATECAYVSDKVIIPLSEIYPILGDEEQLPYSVANNLKFSLEFDNQNNLFNELNMGYVNPLTYACEDKLAVPDTDEGKRVFTTKLSNFKTNRNCGITAGDYLNVKYTRLNVVRNAQFAVQFTDIVDGKLEITAIGDVLVAGSDNTDISIIVVQRTLNGDRNNQLRIADFGAGNAIATTKSFLDNEIPYFVGEAIEIVYTNNNARVSTIRKITAIAKNAGSNVVTLTVDGVAFGAGNTDAYAHPIGATSVNYTIDDLKLVLFQEDMMNNKNFKQSIGNDMMAYNMLDLQPVNKESTSNFERVFHLKPNAEKMFILNKRSNELMSDDKFLNSYRLSINNVPTTDRNIEMYSPLHKDRLMRVFGQELGNLNDDDIKFICELVATNDPYPMIQTYLNSSNQGDLDKSIIHLYSFIKAQMKI